MAILGGVLVLAVVAGGLTEATLALGHNGSLADDLLVRHKERGVYRVLPSPSVTPTPSPTPTSVLTPASTPTPTPVVHTATTNAFVHMRAAKSLQANILIDLNGATKVELLSDADAQWQQVRYNGLVGYIFKTYLTY